MSEAIELYPSWKQLLKIASAWEYGTFHEHSEIADILHMKGQTNKYYQAVSSANADLTLCGKRLDIIQGKGYMVVEPGKYVEVSQQQKDRGLRHYKIATFITGSAPVDKMTEKEKSIHDQHHIQNASVLGMLQKDKSKCYKLLNMQPKLKLNSKNPEAVSNETT
jgi:hypothetical protein